jgi:hypothetical protein
VTIVDLGSANGVFVNQKRVGEPVQLRDGDRVLIGTDELGFFIGVMESDGISSFTSGVDIDPDDATAAGRAPPPPKVPSARVQHAETVPFGDAQEVLTSSAAFGIVERMLARGDRAAAVRALTEQLRLALDHARSGAELPVSTLDAAASACARVARATGEATWLDRCFELHIEARALTSQRALETIEPLWPAPGADCEALGRYQELVRSRLAGATPEELALCERVISLGV